jgi:protein-S-isoprenylcysteine O-methyltransferase Ste14
MPSFHPDWKKLIKKAWSLRLMAVAGLLSALEGTIQYIPYLASLPPGLFSAVTFMVIGAAFYMRLIAQRNMKNTDDKTEKECRCGHRLGDPFCRLCGAMGGPSD